MYTLGKVNVYTPWVVNMDVWYWPDISFKQRLSLHLKIPHPLQFFNDLNDNLSDYDHAIISLKIWVGTYIGMSYIVYSQSIGEEWWEISIIFLVLSSTKGTEESSALDSIIIDLIKTCSFCTQINFFVIRWWCMGSQFDLLDADTVILLAKCTNSMTVSE